MMQKNCAACSAVLDPDATFCPSCAAPVAPPAQTIVCPQCGQSVNAASKFCKYCAFSLNGAPAAETPQSYPSPQPQAVAPPVAAAQTFGVPQPAAAPPLAAPFRSEATPPGGQPHAFVAPAVSTLAPAALSPAAAFPAPAAEPKEKGSLLTPAGAGIVVICFFMPWVQFSCGSFKQSVTGMDIASRGESGLWIVLGAAAVIIAAYFLFRAQRQVAKSRPVVIVSALVGLAVMAYKGYNFMAGEQTIFGRITPRLVGLTPEPGALGTFLGFGLSLVGAILMRAAPGGSAAPALARAVPRAPMRENVAGALCYAAAPAFLVLWVLRLPLLAIPLSYVLWVAAPLVFLLVRPHSESRAVRVHAFQSALLSAGFCAIAFFRVLLVPGLNLEEYTPGHTVGDGLWQLLYGALLVVMLFLMYSAYDGRPARLPAVTDFAEKLADKGRRATPGM